MWSEVHAALIPRVEINVRRLSEIPPPRPLIRISGRSPCCITSFVLFEDRRCVLSLSLKLSRTCLPQGRKATASGPLQWNKGSSRFQDLNPSWSRYRLYAFIWNTSSASYCAAQRRGEICRRASLHHRDNDGGDTARTPPATPESLNNEEDMNIRR